MVQKIWVEHSNLQTFRKQFISLEIRRLTLQKISLDYCQNLFDADTVAPALGGVFERTFGSRTVANTLCGLNLSLQLVAITQTVSGALAGILRQ